MNERRPLTVLSYNILEGGAGRLPAIAALIRAQGADAVALLEVNDRANGARIADTLGMTFIFGEAYGGAHIAWLSRLPVTREENHRHPGLAKTLLEIAVVWQGAPLHLFAAHLGSRWDAAQPVTEAPIILTMLAAVRARPHLLVGDFNALVADDPVGTPPAGVEPRGDARDGAPRLALRPLRTAGYIDCYRAAHADLPGYTYPAHHPWLRLDYLFADPQMARHLTACDVVVGEDARHASDHLPIRATFSASQRANR